VKPFIVLIASIVVGTPAVAMAQSAPATYVEGALGSSFDGRLRADGVDAILGPFAVKEDVKPGWMASLLVGRQLGASPVYLEAEGVYLANQVKTPDLDAAFGTPLGVRSRVYGALANVRLAAPQPFAVGGLALSPYVAGGVGYGRTDISILGDHYPGDGWMWQGKVGVSLQATPRLSWDLAYRYMRLPSFDTDKLGLAAHFRPEVQAISVGVRYELGERR
jgi:opacity protein-like surface antigen